MLCGGWVRRCRTLRSTTRRSRTSSTRGTRNCPSENTRPEAYMSRDFANWYTYHRLHSVPWLIVRLLFSYVFLFALFQIVRDAADLFRLIEQGNTVRKVAATNMNDTSSRCSMRTSSSVTMSYIHSFLRTAHVAMSMNIHCVGLTPASR